MCWGEFAESLKPWKVQALINLKNTNFPTILYKQNLDTMHLHQTKLMFLGTVNDLIYNACIDAQVLYLAIKGGQEVFKI